MRHSIPPLHDIRGLFALMRDRVSTRDTSESHSARVRLLAERAEALGVTGRVSRALGRRLKAEGKSIFEEIPR